MNFKYAITVFTILLLQVEANAQTAELPIISSVAQNAKDFIPNGWKQDKQVGEVSEDFNNDGLPDHCYIARKDGVSILFIIHGRKDNYFVKSFAGVIYAADYLYKITKRNKTLALVFDFPSEGTHLVTTYARYQNNDWYVIGYAEEAYTGSNKTTKGTMTDVNLVTGDVEEYTLVGTKKTLKKKRKEQKQPLLLLQNVDNLSVMNY